MSKDDLVESAPLFPAADIWNNRVDDLYFDNKSLIEQYGYDSPPTVLSGSNDGPVDPNLDAIYEKCNFEHVAVLRRLLDAFGGEIPLAGWAKEVQDELRSSGDVSQLAGGWVECMHQAGFSQTRFPADPNEKLTKERAIADYLCGQSTGYYLNRAALQARYLKEWISDHPSEVAAVSELWQSLANEGAKLAGD